jgi:hypothetical protein
MTQERENKIHDLAAQHLGLQVDDSDAFKTISAALRQVADDTVDSGLGFGGADFWLKIGGVEYFLHAERSKAQKQANSAPQPQGVDK